MSRTTSRRWRAMIGRSGWRGAVLPPTGRPMRRWRPTCKRWRRWAMLTLTSEIRTPYHRIRAGAKLAGLCAATVGLVVLDSLAAMLLANAAVALANLVTMTSRFDDLVEVVMWGLAPLARLGVNTAPIGFAIVLVVRFIPVMLDKARLLIDAWRARSPRRPGWQVALPITLVAVDDAEHVAEALRARGGFDMD